MAKQPVIDSLKGKVARIIEDNMRLRGEYDALMERNDKLNRENRELKLKQAEMERKLKRLELGTGFLANADDKKRVRQRINQLMREIDKCIALMDE